MLRPQEVHDVSILHGNHGISCRRRGFYRRLAALAVKVSRKNRTGEVLPNSEERKNQNVDQNELRTRIPR